LAYHRSERRRVQALEAELIDQQRRCLDAIVHHERSRVRLIETVTRVNWQAPSPKPTADDEPYSPAKETIH
jgi:hypothetical protein